MSDERSERSGEPDGSIAETLDLAVRRISVALMVGAAIVGGAIYARPGPPRFEAFAVGNQIVRVDTRKGTIIACEGQRTCQILLQRGQRVTRVKRSDNAPLPSPATPLPAPPAAGR